MWEQLSFIRLFQFYWVSSQCPGMEPSVPCQHHWAWPHSVFQWAFFPVTNSLFFLHLISSLHFVITTFPPTPPRPDLSELHKEGTGGGKNRGQKCGRERKPGWRWTRFRFLLFPASTKPLFCFPEIINFSKRDFPGWDSFTCRWHFSSKASIALPPPPPCPLLSLSFFHSRSIRPFRALSPVLPFCLPPSLSFSPAWLPSYIKQTVSLAALGDIVLIFQHCRTGVMQRAAVDTLHEDLSLLKWAKSRRASLSDASIYPRRTFLISGLCCWKYPPLRLFLRAWSLVWIWCLTSYIDRMVLGIVGLRWSKSCRSQRNHQQATFILIGFL